MEESGRVPLALAENGDRGWADEGLLESLEMKCLRIFEGDQHEHPEHSEAEVGQAGQAALQISPGRGGGRGRVRGNHGARGHQGTQHQPEPDQPRQPRHPGPGGQHHGGGEYNYREENLIESFLLTD